MTKLKLLATTAMVIGVITFSSHANAEDMTWYQSMTQSVKNWFAPQEDTTAEIKAYLDEVTIAVPPLTGEEAAQIEPAAGGDYQPTLEEALENDDQSFNTERVFSNQGSVAAFEDPITAEDMANIMPAAGESEVVAEGDAEAIVDESIVVVEETATDATENMEDALNNLAEETQEQATEVEAAAEETTIVEDATEMASDAVDATTEAVSNAVDTTTEAVSDAYDASAEMVNDAVDAVTTDAEVEVEADANNEAMGQ